ncbi:MAG: AMP-binding protein [Alphaproteobacteria bacterium]|nr:AMP-binding protein [Alphaproteobacteria bacterium]
MTIVALNHHDWIASHALRRPDALAADFGVGVGDRVAALAQRSTDVFELQFACFRIGAIFVPLNWRLAPVELAAILANCTPTVLAHDAGLAVRAAELCVGGPCRTYATGAASAFEAAAASARAPAQRARTRANASVATRPERIEFWDFKRALHRDRARSGARPMQFICVSCDQPLPRMPIPV